MLLFVYRISYLAFTSDLVWDGIGENLSALVSTWWENESIVGQLNAFRGVGTSADRISRRLTPSQVIVCPLGRATGIWLQCEWPCRYDFTSDPRHHPGRFCPGSQVRENLSVPLGVYFTPLNEFRVVKELQSRFEHFMKTGDDSRIPPDLQRVTFITVCQLLKIFLETIDQDPPHNIGCTTWWTRGVWRDCRGSR